LTVGSATIANTALSASLVFDLPAAPTAGDSLRIVDGYNFQINNLYIGRNGNTIENIADNLQLDVTGVEIIMVYSGTTWKVYPTLGKQGASGPSGPSGPTGPSGPVSSYPGAGIAVSTGSAWDTSLTAPSGTIVGTSDSQTLTSKTLTNPTITNYTETNFTATVTSNAITLALANGTYQTITTMVGANAITLPGVSGNAGKSMTVQLVYASTPTSVTFSVASGGTLKFPGSSTPIATLTNGKYDLYSFICDGSFWYGIQAGANF